MKTTRVIEVDGADIMIFICAIISGSIAIVHGDWWMAFPCLMFIVMDALIVWKQSILVDVEEDGIGGA